MALSKMFKENFVLIMGISLPAILMIIFIIVSQLTKAMAEPPEYGFFYTSNKYRGNDSRDYTLHYVIKDGKLHAKASKSNNPNHYTLHLYQYDQKTNRISEIFFDKPVSIENLKKDEKETFLIKETEHLRFDKNATAPDGYEFSYDSHYNRGIITGIFGGSRRQNNIILEKSGSRFVITPPDNNYYNSKDFVGWVVQDHSKSD